MNPEDFDHDYCPDRLAFDQYRKALPEAEEELDSPMDRIADDILQRARGYRGAFPTTSEGFAKVVSAFTRAALMGEAISALVISSTAELIGKTEELIKTARIQAVRALISLVKAPNPHLSLDVAEHVFGLTGDKESDIARRHGIHRQIVSKRVVKMRRIFGIENLQKKKVCKIYRNNRLEQYEKARQRLKTIKP